MSQEILLFGLGAALIYGITQVNMDLLDGFTKRSKLHETNSKVANAHNIKTSNGIRKHRIGQLQSSTFNNPRKNQPHTKIIFRDVNRFPETSELGDMLRKRQKNC